MTTLTSHCIYVNTIYLKIVLERARLFIKLINTRISVTELFNVYGPGEGGGDVTLRGTLFVYNMKRAVLRTLAVM